MRTWLLALSVALLGAMAYQGVVRNDFIDLDDKYYITTHPVVTGSFDLPTLARAFSISDPDIAPYWQPLTVLSFAADHAVFGVRPAGYHAENVLWHLASAVVLLLLLATTTGNTGRAAIVAALFAIHPIGVEAVAWAIERRVVLAGFFGILGVFLYVLWVRRGAAWLYAASILALLLSLMAKVLFVAAPALLLAVDFWPLRRRDVRRCLLEKIPVAVPCLAVAALVNHTIDLSPEVPHAGMDLRLANVPLLPFRYLRDLVWPTSLAIYYPFPESIPTWQVVAAAAALVAITVAAWRCRRSAPYLLFGWAWFLLALVPSLGLKQQGLWAASADRHAYVASIGFLVALVWGAADASRGIRYRWARPVAAVSALAILVLITLRDVSFWRDSITLYTRLTEVTGPRDSYPDHLLGMALVEANRREEGVRHLERAVAINPRNFDALLGLGVALVAVDDARAAGLLAHALREYPDSVEAREALADLLNRLGRCRETVLLYRDVPVRTPRGAFSLAMAYAALGEPEAARRIASGLPPHMRAKVDQFLSR